ncbi:MAG: DUF3060 domain-containing protein [Deltaproteobacteria bacterium]|nr:DUF3060 domain-containing protein [Deltaproteobacteria bacterium]
MTKTLLVAALLSMSSVAAADVTVTDNKQTVDIDCAKDKLVNIIGNHATITLKGTCTKVSISGNHANLTGSANTVWIAGNNNNVTLPGVDSLTIAGNSNNVTYKGPITAKTTKVSNPGSKNNVTQQR